MKNEKQNALVKIAKRHWKKCNTAKDVTNILNGMNPKPSLKKDLT